MASVSTHLLAVLHALIGSSFIESAILVVGSLVALKLWLLLPPFSSQSDEPPYLPYGVPWVANGLAFITGGAGNVFETARKRFGLRPYTIQIFGEKIYIFTDPRDATAVMNNGKTLSANTYNANGTKPLYGLVDGPEYTILEQMNGVMKADGHQVDDIHQWARNALADARDTLITKTVPDIEATFEKLVTPTEVELFVWVRNTLGIPLTNMFFGPGLLQSFPGLLDAMWVLDIGFWKLLDRPRFLAQDIVGARESMVEAFKVYLADTPEGEKMREGALTFGVGRYDDMRTLGFSLENRARAAVCMLQATHTNATPNLVWLIIHIVTYPGLLTRIREEVAPAFSMGYQNPDVEYLVSHKSCPLLHSVFSETIRHASQNFLPRQVDSPTVIGGYTLQPGAQVWCPTRVLNLDANAWGPDVMEFNPERFIEKPMDVNGPVMKPFGGGPNTHRTPLMFLPLRINRRLAAIEMKVFAASAVMQFNFDFLDGMPKMNELTPSFGTMHPLGPTRTRISRRK